MKLFAENFKIHHFLIIWLIINLIQGTFVQLHADEAYYWVYSKFLDWGYYDHPPMTALFAKAGSLFSKNEIGVRLFSVLTNVIGVYLLWKTVKPYAKNEWLFGCLFFSFGIFHMCGFINSPDNPLFFFSILYLYSLRKYLNENTTSTACIILLSLSITGMLYSKYHGILILLFTLLAEWKLIKRPSFLIIVLICVVLYLPHIIWQINNGYPSLQYHLFERHKTIYRFSFTTDYLANLLAVTGPFTSWFIYYKFFKNKSRDRFIRVLKFIFWGFILFFLATSFKSYVQAQWVLIAYLPLFIWGYICLAKYYTPVWFYKLLYVTCGLVLVLRLALILPVPFIRKMYALSPFWGYKDLENRMKKYAEDKYIIFRNSFQDASFYNFYNKTLKGFSYDARSYRKTQYDYWPIEDSIRNKNVVLVQPESFDIQDQDTIKTEFKGIWYGINIDNVRLYQKVDITCDNLPDTLFSNKIYPLSINIHNPYDEYIFFSNEGQKRSLFFEYGFTKYIWDIGEFFEFGSNYGDIKIAPKQSIKINMNITAPSETGHKFLMFSLRTDPFEGARNSKKYPVYVVKK